MRQPKPIRSLVFSDTANPELAYAAETHACDNGCGAEIRELVRVPADALIPAAVAVDKRGIDMPSAGFQLAAAARAVCEVCVYAGFDEGCCGSHAGCEDARPGHGGTLVGVLFVGWRGGSEEEAGSVRRDDRTTEEREFGGRRECGAFVK